MLEIMTFVPWRLCNNLQYCTPFSARLRSWLECHPFNRVMVSSNPELPTGYGLSYRVSRNQKFDIYILYSSNNSLYKLVFVNSLRGPGGVPI